MVEPKKERVEKLSKKSSYFFLLFYALALILLYLIFRPFLTYLILGGIIAFFMYPINKWVQGRIKNRVFSSFIMTILVLIIILIPLVLITTSLIKESSNVYKEYSKINLDDTSTKLSKAVGFEIDLKELLNPLITKTRELLTTSIPGFISSISELVINLFVMFFLIYYAFKEGDVLVNGFMNMLPISKSHTSQLKDETKKVLYGVIYMQFLVALIQGTLGGIGFWIFGIPNPVLWGIIMVILSFIPFLGTPLVWGPAVILEIASGNIWIGIGLLLYSGILVLNIDNVIKPKLIGDETGMHPVLVLIGIFGGIALFGMIGMIIGPVVVALCFLVIKFFNKDVHFA